MQTNLSSGKFVNERATAAMSRYVPLAGRLFSAAYLDNASKHTFAKSLVESSLLYMCHVKCFAVSELRKLNSVYMRIMRRNHGASRFDDTCDSDVVFRRTPTSKALTVCSWNGDLHALHG